jgi:hypothetical protein
MLTVKRPIKIMTNVYKLLFKNVDDDVKEHPVYKNVTLINAKLKLKIYLFLFFFQNSAVYDLSNCCVTFVPHCIFMNSAIRKIVQTL